MPVPAIPMRWIFIARGLSIRFASGPRRVSVEGRSLRYAFGRAGRELGGELLYLHREAHVEIAEQASLALGLAAAGVPGQLGDHCRAARIEAPALALVGAARGPGVDALAAATAVGGRAFHIEDFVPEGTFGSVFDDAQTG